MSVTLERRVVGPGSDEFLEATWDLKERIREQEGMLRQQRGFFSQAYRQATIYLLVDTDESVVGFGAVRRDGYVLFLAVAPDHRHQGLGRLLIEWIADEYDSVSCHARTTNHNAIEFYEHLGFEIERKIDHYYEDGGAAYYLRLAEDRSITDRVSEFFNGENES